ncbi:putative cytochrome P450, partial [Tanacetum coccineum]
EIVVAVTDTTSTTVEWVMARILHNPDFMIKDQNELSEVIAFGSGRRICPGIPLGEKMLMYIVASLLHSFEWSLPKDDKFTL